MFTGLIGEIGTLLSMTRRSGGAGFSFGCPSLAGEIRPGDSIAVDGACLTAESSDGGGFSAYASRETISKSTLGALRRGDRVNLELSLRPADRLGGHIVQGHVEGIAEVLSLKKAGEGMTLEVRLPEELLASVAPKGSIALSGISLTVAGLSRNRVSVAVVPSTLAATTMGTWRCGRLVNVETDLVARHVVRYLQVSGAGGRRTVKDLEEGGF